MNKILTLSVVALVFSVAPVMAEDGQKGGADMRHGGKAAKYDLDGDGFISRSEFLKRAEERFQKIDANGDGKLGQEERRAAHQAKKEKMKEKRKERQERKGASGDNVGE